MSDISERIAQLSPVKRALLALEKTQSRLDAIEYARTEPIAVVGMGCRFPGGCDDPQAFWRLLRDGVDAIGEVPPERWDIDAYYDPDPEAPGKMYTRWGGFLDRVDRFDAQFFGISPREAMSMDPQQRLLLEVTWEALERAGQVPDRLAGSQTGVFVGIMSPEYVQLLKLGDPTGIDVYFGTGNGFSAAAGRLSYTLGLQGPNMAVDTACSSSLVAVHLACQSLRAKECDMALAGGVSLMLAPELTIYLCKARTMAADGRCKTFDAAADGFVRGEGCGMLVLKRLSDAMAAGDEILALVRGSAVNHDGRSGGFTVPNGLAQQAVIRQALAHAGVAAAQVSYVEAHGTGTPLGDPIELRALEAALGAGRLADQPLLVGSVKTNFGHLEAAAGVAGLIKVILALQHAEIPPHLHLRALNPHIALQQPVVIPTERTPWHPQAGQRIAGISSFGLSGTNAHVLLEEAPPRPTAPPAAPADPTRVELLPLSARSPQALVALARAYRDLLAADQGLGTGDWGLGIGDWGQGDKETRRQGDKETTNTQLKTQNSKLKTSPPSPAVALRDICYTASVWRAHHDHRLALVVSSREELAERLEAFLASEERPGMSFGSRAAGRRRKLVFVFPGQGPQWAGMGRALLEREPVFRAALLRCDELLRRCAGWSLIEELAAGESHSRLHETEVAQPALFALQVALAALWRSWGIAPDTVVGHSMGEVAAAHVAGALSLEDAVQVIFQRGRLMQRTSGQGKTAAVELPADELRRALAGYEGRLSVAAINSPTATALSGDPSAVDEVLQMLQRRQIFARLLRVNHAFHSPQMDPLRDELVQALREIRPGPAAIPIISTVTGRAGDGPAFHAAYWGRNLREPVLFAAAVDELASDDAIFLELSPHPVLASAIAQCAAHRGRDAVVLASLRRGEDERAALLGSLGALYAYGRPVEWQALYPSGGRRVYLPSYPWQRERYWPETTAPAVGSGRDGRRGDGAEHPLLGRHLGAAHPTGQHFWENELDRRLLPYLDDHQVEGMAVLPAAAVVELALAATAAAFGAGSHTLEQLAFSHLLALPDDAPPTVQLVLAPDGPGAATWQLFSHPHGAAPTAAWTRHANGTIRLDSAQGSGVRGQGSDAPEEQRTKNTEQNREHHPEEPRTKNQEPRDSNNQELGTHDELKTQNLKLNTQNFEEGTEGGRSQESDVSERQTQNLKLNTQNFDEVIAGEAFYERMQAHGLQYGPAFQGLEQIWRRDGVALGRLRLPTAVAAELPAYQAHPALLDSGFQVVAAALAHEQIGASARYLPVGIAQLRCHGPVAQAVWAYARLTTPTAPDAATIMADLLLCDDAGQVLLEARGLRLQRMAEAHPAQDALDDWLYQLVWQPAPSDQPAAPDAAVAGAWLLFADRGGVAVELQAQLAVRGERCVMVFPGERYRQAAGAYELDPAVPQEFGQLLRAVCSEAEQWRGVVHLWSLDTDAPEPALADLAEAQRAGCESVLHLVQGLAQAGLRARLWLVTHGAVAVAAENVAVAQAPLWGLGRVVAQEHPEWRCTNVDLGARSDSAALAAELWADGAEDQVALRGGERYLARLVRCPPQPVEEAYSVDEMALVPAGDTPYRLEIVTPGVLDNLLLRATARQAPAPGEVEIQVRASGLNFLDVMSALGVRPDLPAGPPPLGFECAGTISALGTGVEGLAIGDEVIAVALSSFSTFVTTPAAFVAPRPPQLSFEQAAGIPIAFLTAVYALQHLGRLSKGERILIHAAAGGVGLAAVQLAQHIGAEIFATAGSPEKRDFLRSLGVEHVLDSRSLAFADEVIERTGGKGVDVVLNSLAGEAIPRSLATLRANGRFLEIGKRDIYQNSQLGLGQLRNNIAFFAVDLLPLLIERPDFCAPMLRELARQFASGALQPLPSQVFPISDVAGAFRFMAQARHIGKIVVSLDDPAVKIAPPDAAGVRADATYLIAGGLGGLGLTVARWLVEQGARHLVLLGRYGAGAAVQPALDALAQRGAQVLAARADVADPAQLAAVLAEVERSMPPLRGVVHAAAVLDDGILLRQNAARFRAVLAPKVLGAWNLHMQTRAAPLEFFVLFSSVAALLGAPGQGNYAAANAFLDALAAHRRALGLPALSIGWGPWAEVGMAARANQLERLAMQGIGSLTPQQGLAALDRLLGQRAPQVAVMNVNWRRWCQLYPAAAEWPLLAQLLQEQNTAGQAPRPRGADRDLRERLLAAPAGRPRRSLMESYLKEQTAHVLRLAPSRIDPQQPLDSLGVDSLMALELKNRLERGLGLTLSATLAWNYPTIAALAVYLLGELGIPVEADSGRLQVTGDRIQETPEAGTDPPSEDLAAILEEMEQLSEDEVRRLLGDELMVKEGAHE